MATPMRITRICDPVADGARNGSEDPGRLVTGCEVFWTRVESKEQNASMVDSAVASEKLACDSGLDVEREHPIARKALRVRTITKRLVLLG